VAREYKWDGIKPLPLTARGDLGKAIYVAIVRSKVSLSAAALHAGTSRQSLTRIIKGRNSPRPPLLRRICAALGLDHESFRNYAYMGARSSHSASSLIRKHLLKTGVTTVTPLLLSNLAEDHGVSLRLVQRIAKSLKPKLAGS